MNTKLIEGWLAARDADSLEKNWRAMAPRDLGDITPSYSFTTEQGVMRLAAELLAWPLDRLSWLATGSLGGPPSQNSNRLVTRSYLENAFDIREPCHETYEVKELRDGQRGVQRVNVGFGIDDGSRDGAGGGATVVRVFDLEVPFALSVELFGRHLSIAASPESQAVLGPRALHALDLFSINRSFHVMGWKTYDRAALRALLTTLVAPIDGGFSESATWPGAAKRLGGGEVNGSPGIVDWHFTGPNSHAVRLRENSGNDRRGAYVLFTVEIDGLPWGWSIQLSGEVSAKNAYSTLSLRLPRAQFERFFAELPKVPGLMLG